MFVGSQGAGITAACAMRAISFSTRKQKEEVCKEPLPILYQAWE